MILPIGDDQDHDRPPAVTVGLIVLASGTFLLFCLTPSKLAESVTAGGLVAGDVRPIPLLAHMLLHANLLHLAGNLLFLWIFGRLIEERLGYAGYVLFLVGCGVAAAGLQLAAAEHDGVPMIGASGAVSGAVGACLVFCPRAHIKVFYWFWFSMGEVLLPLTVWILAWFAEQVWFSHAGLGNTGTFAHLGGFGAGYAAAWMVRALHARLHPRPGPPLEPRDAASLAAPRRAFDAGEDAADAVALDDAIDAYAVVELAPAGGVAARRIPRAEAEALRKKLQDGGVAAALIADQPANHPPVPEVVDGASWDDRTLRLRVGDRIVPVAWPAPFLVVGACVDGRAFIDLYLGRKAAYRIPGKPELRLTRVDPRRRSEEAAGLAGLARDFERLRGGRGADDGLRRLAQDADPGAIARSAEGQADAVFRLFHLARAGQPLR